MIRKVTSKENACLNFQEKLGSLESSKFDNYNIVQYVSNAHGCSLILRSHHLLINLLLQTSCTACCLHFACVVSGFLISALCLRVLFCYSIQT